MNQWGRKVKYVTSFMRLTMLGLCAWMITSANEKSLAADVDLRERIDPWGLYCVKGVTKPQYNDCSLAMAVSAKDDPSMWAKMAIAVVSKSGDLSLTIETPRLRYIKAGVSMAIARDQSPEIRGPDRLAKIFFDECVDTKCIATVRLNGGMLSALWASNSARIEYQISESETIRLTVNTSTLSNAVIELLSTIGTETGTLEAVRDRQAQFIVEARTPPDQGDWGHTLNCGTQTAPKIVTVSTTTIIDEPKLNRWVLNAQSCDRDSVFWIFDRDQIDANKGSETITQIKRLMLFDAVKEQAKKNEVVVVSPDGVPTKPDGR